MTEHNPFEWPAQARQSLPLPRPVEEYRATETYEPGVRLHNFTTRVPNEDGTYVVVTTHKEHIEKIPQPPTPEEIAAQQKSDRIAVGVVATIAVGFFAFIGWVAYQDEKHTQREREARAAKTDTAP